MQLPRVLKIAIGILTVMVAVLMVLEVLDEVADRRVEQSRHEVSYEGKEGVDVFTLLNENYAVETSGDSEVQGFIIESIDGVRRTEDEFWVFYVNGEPWFGEYITHNGDDITWKLHSVKICDDPDWWGRGGCIMP